MKAIITESDIYEQIRKLLEYREARVCRHHIACNLLDLLELRGCTLDDELVKAVVDADDATALALLPSSIQREFAALEAALDVAYFARDHATGQELKVIEQEIERLKSDQLAVMARWTDPLDQDPDELYARTERILASIRTVDVEEETS